jgi:Uma2 family endonuclease
MSTVPGPFLTPEEYLAIEREADYKSEYHDGVMYAIGGGPPAPNANHDRVLRNLHFRLREASTGMRPVIHSSSIRVGTLESQYAHPDLSVACDARYLEGDEVVGDVFLNPSLIVEVVARVSEAKDRGIKFECYREIASLREYLLLASDRMHADLYIKQPSGLWLLMPFSKPDEEIIIESLSCKLLLGSLYENVEFRR